MRFATQRVEPDDVERSAGFLTKTNREYLRGEWDPSGDGEGLTESQKSSKRTEIKARTRHALADFALLQSEGDEELKQGVVNLDVDPPLFPEKAPENFTEGLLRFATDASGGEEVTKILWDALDEGLYGKAEGDESTALKYAMGGNSKMALRSYFRRWAPMLAELGVSKAEAIEELERAWPE